MTKRKLTVQSEADSVQEAVEEIGVEPVEIETVVAEPKVQQETTPYGVGGVYKSIGGGRRIKVG